MSGTVVFFRVCNSILVESSPDAELMGCVDSIGPGGTANANFTFLHVSSRFS